MRSRLGRADALVAILLLAGVVAYLHALPPSLDRADESYFLYEAKRLREGEVLYRDVFQFVTPLSPYVMAGLYWLFGTTLTTARLGMAALHGLTAIFLYAAGRQLGVRRLLAVLPPLAFLAISHAVWPYASWHWFSTCFTALLLWTLLATPWATRPRAAGVVGVVNGLLICTQQQKGVLICAGVCLIFLVDALAGWRYRESRGGAVAGWRVVGRDLAYCLGSFWIGLLMVVVPTIALFWLLAGFQPLYEAWVAFPLESYRDNIRIGWGRLALFANVFAPLTYPTVLRWLPVALVPLALRAAADLIGGTRRLELRSLLVLLILGTFNALSVWYYPDVIHIAFIAPPFFLAVVETAAWFLAFIRPPRLALAVSVLLLALVSAELGRHLWRNLERAREKFPILHDTAFGRVAFETNWEAATVDDVRNLMQRWPTRELFCFPNLAAPYLTTGAVNPTPFQYFVPKISPKRHTELVLEILRERKLPYILGSPLFMRTRNPVVEFLEANYEIIVPPAVRATGEFPAYWIYARKDRPPDPPPERGS